MTGYFRDLVVSVPNVPTSKSKGRWLAARVSLSPEVFNTHLFLWHLASRQSCEG